VHVMVCGAGVIGITTAYYLAKAGHQVSVVDRRDGPGEEASFADGGLIAPSLAEPWASPANVKRLIGALGRRNAPLVYRLRLDPPLWEWTVRFLVNANAVRQAVNRERMLRIALHGRDMFRELRDAPGIDTGIDTGIADTQPRQGTLHIFRSQSAFDAACRQADGLRALGISRHAVGADQCRTLEPALGATDGLVGGFHCPDDETADSHAFTMALARRCEDMGVRFYYDISISAMSRRDRNVIDVRTTRGPFRADGFVLALGAFSPLIAKTVDLALPVQPVKGYSVTIPVADDAKAPALGVIDAERQLAYSRLGDKVRAAGLAEIGGFDTYVDRARADILRTEAQALFPGGLAADTASAWAGLSPHTPDSVPIIGRTRLDNLFINTGHGGLGWTMACGSASLIAEMISNRPPGIDTEGLGPARFFGLNPGAGSGKRSRKKP